MKDILAKLDELAQPLASSVGVERTSGPGPGPGVSLNLGLEAPAVSSVNLTVPGYSNLNIKLNFQSPQPPSDPQLVSQYLPHVNQSLRRSGYAEKVADEVTIAMRTLSIHGVLEISPITITDTTDGPPSIPNTPVNPTVGEIYPHIKGKRKAALTTPVINSIAEEVQNFPLQENRKDFIENADHWR